MLFGRDGFVNGFSGREDTCCFSGSVYLCELLYFHLLVCLSVEFRGAGWDGNTGNRKSHIRKTGVHFLVFSIVFSLGADDSLVSFFSKVIYSMAPS